MAQAPIRSGTGEVAPCHPAREANTMNKKCCLSRFTATCDCSIELLERSPLCLFGEGVRVHCVQVERSKRLAVALMRRIMPLYRDSASEIACLRTEAALPRMSLQ
eukprot:4671023-Pleurochrysis_carterae.AAC.1